MSYKINNRRADYLLFDDSVNDLDYNTTAVDSTPPTVVTSPTVDRYFNRQNSYNPNGDYSKEVLPEDSFQPNLSVFSPTHQDARVPADDTLSSSIRSVLPRYMQDRVPLDGIRYHVKRNIDDCVKVFLRPYNESFPVILEGVIARSEYNKVLSDANGIVEKVMKTWYYREGFVMSMVVTGTILFVPIIPGLVLMSKRPKKIYKMMKAMMDRVNAEHVHKGYKWSIFRTFDSPRIVLEILNPSALSGQQKFLLMTQDTIESSALRSQGVAGGASR